MKKSKQIWVDRIWKSSGLIAVAAVVVANAAHRGWADQAEPVADPHAWDDTSALTLETDRAANGWASEISGQVTDEAGKGLAGVGLVLNGVEYTSNADGTFRIPGRSSASLTVKKAGYRKLIVNPRAGQLKIALPAQEIKGVYVPSVQLKNNATVDAVLKLIATTELNALVIDVKDDDGRIRRANLKEGVEYLHSKGVYAIARIVTFKDPSAAKKFPNMALLDANTGGIWVDRNNIGYLNPYDERAWEYNIAVAREAVAAGFDEIQFDYVRFPTDGAIRTIKWSKPYNSANRNAAVGGFLKRARKELGAMGVFVAADVFGITAYENADLSGIGQRIEDVTPFLDYVCPMVYPSGYGRNFHGIASPVDQPEAIVGDSVRRYRLRADPNSIVRPWLQSFRDYSGIGRVYGGAEIRAQINGSDKAGGSGWMLWNAAGRYSEAGLKPKLRKILNVLKKVIQ